MFLGTVIVAGALPFLAGGSRMACINMDRDAGLIWSGAVVVGGIVGLFFGGTNKAGWPQRSVGEKVEAFHPLLGGPGGGVSYVSLFYCWRVGARGGS